MVNSETATMYLRNLPRRLIREAKTTAARRGTTLTALVREALEQYLADTPEVQADDLSPIAKDMAWYEANKPKLLRRYEGEYVAIIDGKVVDHNKEFGPLAGRVFKKYGVRAIFMPQVVRGERVVNIPSPWIAR